MPAILRLLQTKPKQFYFSLLSAGGEMLLVSVPFAFRVSCLQAIDQSRLMGVYAASYQKETAVSGEFFFVLIVEEQLLATSGIHAAAKSRDEAMRQAREGFRDAVLEDKSWRVLSR